jgi:hypothetical protein
MFLPKILKIFFNYDFAPKLIKFSLKLPKISIFHQNSFFCHKSSFSELFQLKNSISQKILMLKNLRKNHKNSNKKLRFCSGSLKFRSFWLFRFPFPYPAVPVPVIGPVPTQPCSVLLPGKALGVPHKKFGGRLFCDILKNAREAP